MAIRNPLTGEKQKVIVKPLKAITHEDLAKAKEKAKPKKEAEKKPAKKKKKVK